MTPAPLRDALDRFCRNELSYDQLLDCVERLRGGDEARAVEMSAVLDAAFGNHEIPPQVYFSLKSRLASESPLSPADDATRVAAVRPGLPPAGLGGIGRTVVMPPGGDETAAHAPTAGSDDGMASTVGQGHEPTAVATAGMRRPDVAAEPRFPQTLKVGDTLKDRFVLQEVLGSGGMGVVFKALDLRRKEASDRDPYVALKVLNQDFRDNPLSFVALQRESKRAQALSHPNIIHVYDFDRDGPHVFMSMEYLQGIPLNRLIKDLPEGGMPFQQAWPLIQGMSEALAHAHKKNIVHSDFKPGNVFVDEHQEVRVLDFGIACAVGRQDKGDATVFNARDLGALTPAYASLEMLQGKEPDARDDIYALACVTYELLSGRHPFGRLPADKVLELGLQPKPIPGLKHRRWKGLQKALALKREDRTATVAEFIRVMQVRSPAFYGAWVAGLIVPVAIAINAYLEFRHPKPLPTPTVTLSAEQKLKIKDLLDVAEIHFEVGYLTAPTGSNALWAYREALKIDPYNKAAIAGIEKIADALEQKAWQLFEEGNRAESLKAVNEGLEADPQHQGLLRLRSKLQS